MDYFESTEANQWLDSIKRNTMWTLLDNQHDFLYMFGELGKGRKPMLKNNAWEYIYDKVALEMGDIINEVVSNIIDTYHKSDIDMPYEVASDYNAWNGLKEGDTDYIEPYPSEEE